MPSITFLTHGTRGDIEPLFAQALFLHKQGYSVRFAGPKDFKGWVEGHGINYLVLGDMSMREMLHTSEVQGLIGYNPIKIWRAMAHFKAMFREILVDGLANIPTDTDLIIAHASLAAASDVAEKCEAPVIFLSPVPFAPTKTAPALVIPYSLGALNKLSYFPLRLIRLIYPSFYRDLRKRLGLKPTSIFMRPFQSEGSDARLVHSYSPALLPPPDDWPETTEVIGYSFFDEDGVGWEPSAALQTFLNAGAPPIYIGFGSMVPSDRERLGRIISEAVKMAGVRVILGSGWAALSAHEPSPDIFTLKETPHHKLFPYCRAVVHHGGAGTTAAGLRAGKPTLICPFGFDQPFWGRVVQNKQLGPMPIALKKLSAGALAGALIDLVTNADYADNARTLAAMIAKDDAKGRILELVRKEVGKP